MYSEIQNTVHAAGDTVEQIQIQFGWEVGADDGWLRSFKTFKGLDWVLKLTELVCKQTKTRIFLALPSFPECNVHYHLDKVRSLGNTAITLAKITIAFIFITFIT